MMSPLFSFSNNAPIFLELSSISRFLEGLALDVSSNNLVSVAITGLSSHQVHLMNQLCAQLVKGQEGPRQTLADFVLGSKAS